MAVRLGKCGGFYLRHGWLSEHLPLTAILGQTIFQKMGWSLNPWSASIGRSRRPASRGQTALRESGEKALPQSHQPKKVTSLSSGGGKKSKERQMGFPLILLSWEWRESGSMGSGGHTPLTDPHEEVLQEGLIFVESALRRK